MVVLAGCGVQLAKGLTPGATAISATDFLARLRLAHAAGWDDADAPARAAGGAGGAAVAPPAAAFDWASLGRACGKLFRWAPSSGPHMCAEPRASSVCASRAC